MPLDVSNSKVDGHTLRLRRFLPLPLHLFHIVSICNVLGLKEHLLITPDLTMSNWEDGSSICVGYITKGLLEWPQKTWCHQD